MSGKETLGSSLPIMDKRARSHIWEERSDSDWERLRQIWWGIQGYTLLGDVLARPPSQRFIEVISGDIRNAFQMRRTSGSLFVREEYWSLAEGLRDVRRREPACATSGCLLFGQRGIGKTYFLLFFLLDCLSREETVLLTIRKKGTYLFDGSGVAWTATADFDLETQTRIPNPADDRVSRIWSLVDWNEEDELVPSAVTYYPEQLFFVAAVPPDRARYDKVVTDECGVCWWMAPWTDEELLILLRSLPVELFFPEKLGGFPAVNADVVQSLRSEAGPCPRDIILSLRRPRENMERPARRRL